MVPDAINQRENRFSRGLLQGINLNQGVSYSQFNLNQEVSYNISATNKNV